MPDGTNRTPTFNTLTRERTFRHPTKDGSTYNVLNEFVAPHIESFNALFDDSGLPAGDGDGKGILSLALKDIGDRVVFDGSGNENSESATQGWGNRMRIWIEKVTIARPMVPEKDNRALERRVFPSEVFYPYVYDPLTATIPIGPRTFDVLPWTDDPQVVLDRYPRPAA